MTQQCLDSNLPSMDGHYVTQRTEGHALLTNPSLATSAPFALLNRTRAVSIVPLYNYYSRDYQDNLVTTNATAPDSTYNYRIINGYVALEAVPGLIALQVWSRTPHEHATVASDAGVQWAKDNNFVFSHVTGYVYP